jgi:hypothetical protein
MFDPVRGNILAAALELSGVFAGFVVVMDGRLNR